MTPAAAATGNDDAGLLLLAAILLAGGILQFIAAIIGVRRRGQFQTTIGRQVGGALGARGAIVFWVVLGVLLVAAGLWAGIPPILRMTR